MFILKRQDVEITTVQHPNREQQIPILNYQGQTFRLMKVFNVNQNTEALAYWRDLTDNRGKACVLLEEPERYSVWGKVRLDQLAREGGGGGDAKISALVQASLLVLQAVYFDVEDLLGARQAGAFEKDLVKVFQDSKFPSSDSLDAVKTLLTKDPLDSLQIPPWKEDHLKTLLEELYRLGKGYFGNTSFAEGLDEVLEDLPDEDREFFISWLGQSPAGKLWAIG
ncbi:MAG: Npun_F0813 family protein [Limnospira sp.]